MKTNTFVYIDYFSFGDEESKKRFFGHPMQGKVYKALKENVGDVDIYKLPLESVDGTTGIVLEDLEHDGDGKWSHRILEVTDSNLGDLDISVDDLKLIEKEWIDCSEEQEEEDDEEIMVLDVDGVFRKVSDALNIIVDNDEKMFLVLAEIIEDISLSYRPTTDPNLKLEIIERINKLKERRK